MNLYDVLGFKTPEPARPRLRPIRLASGKSEWICGLMEPFFDAGWCYWGMSPIRGAGETREEAFKAWENAINTIKNRSSGGSAAQH